MANGRPPRSFPTIVFDIVFSSFIRDRYDKYLFRRGFTAISVSHGILACPRPRHNREYDGSGFRRRFSPRKCQVRRTWSSWPSSTDTDALFMSGIDDHIKYDLGPSSRKRECLDARDRSMLWPRRLSAEASYPPPELADLHPETVDAARCPIFGTLRALEPLRRSDSPFPRCCHAGRGAALVVEDPEWAARRALGGNRSDVKRRERGAFPLVVLISVRVRLKT